MPSETSLLFQSLHQVLQRLEEAEQALNAAPKRIAHFGKRIAAAEAAIEAQKTRIQQRRKSADELNLRLRSQEADIQKLDGQLNQATSNKEYDIVKGQIANAVRKRGEIEDQALQELEFVDADQQQLRDLESQLRDLNRELDEIRQQAAEDEPGLQAAVDECLAELAEMDRQMPSAESRTVLARLRPVFGASSCAQLDDEGFCAACYNKVTTQDRVRINLGEFVCCRACGRILYVC